MLPPGVITAGENGPSLRQPSLIQGVTPERWPSLERPRPAVARESTYPPPPMDVEGLPAIQRSSFERATPAFLRGWPESDALTRDEFEALLERHPVLRTRYLTRRRSCARRTGRVCGLRGCVLVRHRGRAQAPESRSPSLGSSGRDGRRRGCRRGRPAAYRLDRRGANQAPRDGRLAFVRDRVASPTHRPADLGGRARRTAAKATVQPRCARLTPDCPRARRNRF
jgi:hypothetical protein